MKHLVFGGAFALLALAPSVATAQSLAELARQEEARRKSVPVPAKVYTNESLRAVSPAVTPPVSPIAPPPASTPATETIQGQPQAAPPASTGAGDEASWRKRVATARGNLSRAETFQEALQSRINALSTDFVNRDDPAQRAQIANERQKALAELDRVKQEILQYQKEIGEIQEAARRAGVPAGWVR